MGVAVKPWEVYVCVPPTCPLWPPAPAAAHTYTHTHTTTPPPFLHAAACPPNPLPLCSSLLPALSGASPCCRAHAHTHTLPPPPPFLHAASSPQFFAPLLLTPPWRSILSRTDIFRRAMEAQSEFYSTMATYGEDYLSAEEAEKVGGGPGEGEGRVGGMGMTVWVAT